MWPKLIRAAQTNRNVNARNESLNTGGGGWLTDGGGAM